MTSQIQKLLDDTGIRILQLLVDDARMPYAEIARTVHLSTPAVIERIEKMQAAGIVKGYHAEVDSAALGYTITAIITLITEPIYYPTVRQIVGQSAEVEQCDHVTGDASFVMRVSVRSIAHLEAFIQQFTPIGSTQTAIVMSTVAVADVIQKRLALYLNDPPSSSR